MSAQEPGPAGPQGPPGPGGGGSASEDLDVIAFAFDTPSPLVVVALAAGSHFERAQIAIDETFDDPAAELRLGTGAAPSVFLTASTNTIAQYESDELQEVPSEETLILTINAGSSTRGAGRLLYRVKKP